MHVKGFNFSKDYSYFYILEQFLEIIPCLAYTSDVIVKNDVILVPVEFSQHRT